MSLLRDLASRLYTFWCWAGTFTWMITLSTLGTPLLMLIGHARGHFVVIRPALGWCIPLCGIRVTQHRHPEYDPEVRGIYLQNHVSVLDGHLATYIIPHPFCGLFNSWHFWIPGYGWLMGLSKGIGVPRAKEGRTERLGVAVRNRVFEQHISVLAFPEGHRTLDGRVRDFHRGAFFMAREAGAPVIPFAQRGMYAINNKNSPRFRCGGPVEIYLGKPIQTAGLSDEQVGELADHCRLIARTWVEDRQTPQLDGFPEPPRAATA